MQSNQTDKFKQDEQTITSMTDAPKAPDLSQVLDKASVGGSLKDQLTGNPFFTAGFGLAVVAAAAAVGRKAVQNGASLLYRRMLVDVEVTHHDAAYGPVLYWISAHTRQSLQRTPPTSQGSFVNRFLDRLTPGLHHLQFHTSKVKQPDGATKTQTLLVPGFGRHVVRYRNAFISVNRQREKSFEMNTGRPFETVTLTTLYAHRRILEDLFRDAESMAEELREGKTTMYTAWGAEWRKFGEPKRKRPLESVVLEKNVKETILDDVKAFIGSRTWYLDRGIPYRRGYLLHGPPGTGKSSFIQALAGQLDFDIAMLNVAERGITDDKLNHLLSVLPPRTIVLLEDADAAFLNRRQVDEQGYSGATVTFSGLLNALDGVASAEERIIFLTTNHIDRLDEALIRPGRVDMSVKLGYATEDQIQRLWERFYAEFDPEGKAKQQFMARVQKLGLVDNVSTAALQGIFVYNKGDMSGALNSIETLVKKTSLFNNKQSASG